MSSVIEMHGESELSLTVEELAWASGTDSDWVVRHVIDEHLAIRSGPPDEWRFGSAELWRARRIAAAERMFEVDGDVAAFIADLMDEIQRLRNG
jgi:chaperone modulatory protein CbpM